MNGSLIGCNAQQWHIWEASVRILDLSAGNRNIWADKHHKDTVFVDCRISVKPNVVCNTAMLPFASNAFDLIVFDPPHSNFSPKSPMSRLYGSHTIAEIRDIIAKSGQEAWRVARENCLMAFKWCDHDMNTRKCLSLLTSYWEPLFGHTVSVRTKHASTTKWIMLRRRPQKHDEWEKQTLGLPLFQPEHNP